MQISVIPIGDEILIGQVTDTNSGMIARMIAPWGWQVRQIHAVGDTPSEIARAIEEAFSVTDVVITTGGLGPTKDDVTKQVLCGIFGGTLVEDPSVTENIKAIFGRRGLRLNRLTAAQALVPTSCTVIQNLVGTAPVMWFERRDGKVLVAMPGVPFETETMLRDAVLPRLLERFHSDVSIAHAVVMVEGYTESALAEALEEWEAALPGYLHLAYLPKPGLIRLRVDGMHPDGVFVRAEVARAAAEIKSIVGPRAVADTDLDAAGIMLGRARRHGLTVAAAESCTGGSIARQLTLIPGASDVVAGGVVSYSNEVKMALLGVRAETLEAHGAVSEQVVCQMAEGVLKATGADIAVSTSGIAGPGGGTPDKPVGTVWMAASLRTPEGFRTVARMGRFSGSRSRIIDTAVTHALLLGVRLIDETLG